MKKFVGTASASIAKPWMNELHISKDNLGSLKHELVHTLLSTYGNFPFDISWSTGLTEGAAVAMEESYDGIRNCDEYAARIVQLGLAKGVKEIMSFTGFVAQASGKSYTLAGSFSKYLIQHYGSEKFLSLYNIRQYESIYGKPVDVLEREWIASLQPLQTPMNRYDSLRVRFYFDRTSILNEPCLRKIGRMMKEAGELFTQQKYKEADEIYDLVAHETDRLDAIRGRVLCQLRMNDPKAALTVLDTLSAAKTEQNSAALHTLRGDCIFLATDDTVKAKEEWKETMQLELSSRSVISAYIRYHFLSHIAIQNARDYLRTIYSYDDITDSLLEKIEAENIKDASLEFYAARNAFTARIFESKGKLKRSYFSSLVSSAAIGDEISLRDRYSQILYHELRQFITEVEPTLDLTKKKSSLEKSQ